MLGPNPSRVPPRAVRFPSATAACRHLLQNAATPSGQFLPFTATELAAKLAQEGFFVTERDTEAFLRELAVDGDVVEIDEAAGFRWRGQAA